MDVGKKELAVDEGVEKSPARGAATAEVADGVEEEVAARGAPEEGLVVSEELEEELEEERARLIDPGNGDCGGARERSLRRS